LAVFGGLPAGKSSLYAIVPSGAPINLVGLDSEALLGQVTALAGSAALVGRVP
jgi:hypothetical protein